MKNESKLQLENWVERSPLFMMMLVVTLSQSPFASADTLVVESTLDAHTLERRSGTPGSGGALLPSIGNVNDADDLVLGCNHAVLSASNARSDCSKIFLDFQFSTPEEEQLSRSMINSVTLKLNVDTPAVDGGDVFEVSVADTAWSLTEPPILDWISQPDGLPGFSQGFLPPTSSIDLDVTSIVTGWLDGSLSNFGILLGGAQETLDLFDGPEVDQRTFFVSAESGSGVGPRLEIDFTPTEEVISLAPTDDNSVRLRLLEVPPAAPMPTVESSQTFPASRNNVGCSVAQPTLNIVTNCWSTFMVFDLPDDLEADDLIEASLRLSVFSVGPDAASYFVRRVIEDWNPGSLNFINQPLTDIGALGDAVIIPVPGPGDSEVLLDVTDMVGAWLDGSATNYGIGLLGGDPSALPSPLNADGIVQFSSLEADEGNPANRPVLIITRSIPVPEPGSVLSSLTALATVFLIARVRRKPPVG